jgi:serine/threonine-protein kinase
MTARDSLRKGDWLGDYEIRSRMRSGGMATLFLAQRHGAAGVSRPVVIKVIHPHLAEDEQIVRMFIDEARISSHIRHSNVVYVEKFGEHDGIYYIVMEYVDGCSLLQVIRTCAAEGRKLSGAIAVHLAIEIAAGLHAAHETTGEDGAPLGIVHRDVSPSNVLLTRDGRVKVIDFGIAKAHGRLGATRSGSGIKGKLCYMSPEQAWGDPVDRRIDIYALGICLWELLTTRQLFHAKTDLAVLELVRNPTIPPPSSLHPEVSAALDAVLARATAKRREHRHQTALELRRDLMGAVPAAVAIPPELIAELVRHVCERERKTTELAAAQHVPSPESLLPVPETSVRSAAGEIQPPPWRKRRFAVAGLLGACALGIVAATAGSSDDALSTSPPPPAQIEVIETPTAAATPTPTADTSADPTANPGIAANPNAAANPSVAANPNIAANPNAATDPHTPASPNTANPNAAANPNIAVDPKTAADPSTAADPKTAANRNTAGNPNAAANPNTGADPKTAANRNTAANPSTAANPNAAAAASAAGTDSKTPARRGAPAAPRADKGRVTPVEVDGAVLADEATAPEKAAAKPRKKPASAVHAGGAVLAD